VHFTRAGALRDDTGPAPMASTLNCTNKFTVPPRAVEASRSLPTSASILTNTARAASALHYTGKATPPAHLAENNPLLSLPASAPSVQSVRGPDAMAHLLHREAHTKWPVGTLSMSHRPSRITNNRHAMQHQRQQQRQKQQFQFQRTSLPDEFGQTAPRVGLTSDHSTLRSILDAIRQRHAGSGCVPVAAGWRQAIPTKSTISAFADGETCGSVHSP